MSSNKPLFWHCGRPSFSFEISFFCVVFSAPFFPERSGKKGIIKKKVHPFIVMIFFSLFRKDPFFPHHPLIFFRPFFSIRRFFCGFGGRCSRIFRTDNPYYFRSRRPAMRGFMGGWFSPREGFFFISLSLRLICACFRASSHDRIAVAEIKPGSTYRPDAAPFPLTVHVSKFYERNSRPPFVAQNLLVVPSPRIVWKG